MMLRRMITTENDIINYSKHYRNILIMIPITEAVLIMKITIDGISAKSSYCNNRY